MRNPNRWKAALIVVLMATSAAVLALAACDNAKLTSKLPDTSSSAVPAGYEMRERDAPSTPPVEDEASPPSPAPPPARPGAPPRR